MKTNPESGRYSLAGFLYQIIATAVEGFNVWKHVENDDDVVQVLELEGMGQDLVGKPVYGGATGGLSIKFALPFLKQGKRLRRSKT